MTEDAKQSKYENYAIDLTLYVGLLIAFAFGYLFCYYNVIKDPFLYLTVALFIMLIWSYAKNYVAKS